MEGWLIRGYTLDVVFLLLYFLSLESCINEDVGNSVIVGICVEGEGRGKNQRLLCD